MSSTKDVLATLKNPSISEEEATDALVEWIAGRRRGKVGQTMFEVSIDLFELMQQTPPELDPSFESARSITHLPSHTDLTPPQGLFSNSRSSSRSSVAAVLSRCPDNLSVEHGREVVLEYLLGQEGKMVETKGGYGKGGKGTIAKAGLEELGGKVKDVEASLASPPPEVLSLLLSLRLSLSYLSTKDLTEQLLLLPLGDAELVLRVFVQRRLGGEGRWGVGKVLEALEGNVCQARPALRSVIRTVKSKYLLPDQPRHQIPLPSPSKSKILALLTSHSVSPGTPTSAPPPAYPSNLPSSSSNPLDDPLGSFAMELLSEWLAREKREAMRALKWMKSGRAGLAKELLEVEEKMCFGGKGKGKFVGEVANPALVPIFEVLRRIYVLPPSPELPPQRPLSNGDGGSNPSQMYHPILLAPEDEPYHPPTLQSVTSALYCNPRLTTPRAVVMLMELVEYERDLRMYGLAGRGGEDEDEDDGEDSGKWGLEERIKMGLVLDGIQRRFPDGEYAEAFRVVSQQTDCPPSLSRAPSYTTIPHATPASRTTVEGAARQGSKSISHIAAVQNGSSSSPPSTPGTGMQQGVSPRRGPDEWTPDEIQGQGYRPWATGTVDIPSRGSSVNASVAQVPPSRPWMVAEAGRGGSSTSTTSQGSNGQGGQHARTNSLPTWGRQDEDMELEREMRKMSANDVGVEELRNAITPNRTGERMDRERGEVGVISPAGRAPPATPPRLPPLDLGRNISPDKNNKRREEYDPAEDSEDEEMNALYAGYGDLIQPRSPDSDAPSSAGPRGYGSDMSSPPRGYQSMIPPYHPSTPDREAPPPKLLFNQARNGSLAGSSPSRQPPLTIRTTSNTAVPRIPQAINGGQRTPGSAPPATTRATPTPTNERSARMPTTAPLSANNKTPIGGISKPLPANPSPGTSDGGAPLSPSKWRKEFMGTAMGMLRPAPGNSASPGNGSPVKKR